MEEPRLSRRQLLASTAVGLSVTTAGCSLEAPNSDESGTEPENGFPEEFETPDVPADTQPDSGLAAVYDQVIDSVAAVRIEGTRQRSSGTAWVYDDSYLVTNEHITRVLEDPSVWFENAGWRDAEIVGMDRHSDLGVLEVTAGKPEDATPLPLVGESPPVGTPVAAIGNPFDLPGSLSTGIISGRNRTIDFPQRNFSIADSVQTDAALNPGNSGGPLVTYDGEVAGVVSAGRGDNIGFTISARMTEQVVPSLIENGTHEHAYMGVLLRDVTPAIIEANDLGEYAWGVYVHRVLDGGPSDGVLQGSTSGEREEPPVGGDVIVRLDGRPVQIRDELSAFLAVEADPDETIDVELVRDGEVQTVSLELGARSEFDS